MSIATPCHVLYVGLTSKTKCELFSSIKNLETSNAATFWAVLHKLADGFIIRLVLKLYSVSHFSFLSSHAHSTLSFYSSLGPITPQGTGFLAVQTVGGIKVRHQHMMTAQEQPGSQLQSNKGFPFLLDSSHLISPQASFRIAATGVVLDLDKSVTIVKKLKLIGYPYKIFKNTCFIQVGSPAVSGVSLQCSGTAHQGAVIKYSSSSLRIIGPSYFWSFFRL